MTISTLPDENEQSLIEFARARGMIAMRHPDTDQLYAFDKRSAPEWAAGRIDLAFVTPRDEAGNILPSRENPLGQNVDGNAIFLPECIPSRDELDEMTRQKFFRQSRQP